LKRIFVPTRTGSEWQRLLAKPLLHWKKGKSAMTAAAFREYAGNTFDGVHCDEIDSSSGTGCSL